MAQIETGLALGVRKLLKLWLLVFGIRIACVEAEADMTTSSEYSGNVVLGSLAPGSLIDVETRNRHYHIECLGGNVVRVSGHPEFCPQPTLARVQAPVDIEGAPESGQIGRGMCLTFFLDYCQPITTSKVLSVHVDGPVAGAQKPS